jgi:hypothetical protein
MHGFCSLRIGLLPDAREFFQMHRKLSMNSIADAQRGESVHWHAPICASGNFGASGITLPSGRAGAHRGLKPSGLLDAPGRPDQLNI